MPFWFGLTFVSKFMSKVTKHTELGGSAKAQTSEYMSKAIFWKCPPGQAGGRPQWFLAPWAFRMFLIGAVGTTLQVSSRKSPPSPAFSRRSQQSLGCQPPGGSLLSWVLLPVKLLVKLIAASQAPTFMPKLHLRAVTWAFSSDLFAALTSHPLPPTQMLGFPLPNVFKSFSVIRRLVL